MSGKDKLVVKVKKVEEVRRGTGWIPEAQTEGASGVDLHARLEYAITISGGETVKIPTGIALEIPDGYEGQVRSRSGLTYKHGLIVLGAPSTIDSDYRGEISCIMHNSKGDSCWSNDVIVSPGMRIAQLVIAPIAKFEFEEVDELDETERGEGGFGSTGE